MGEKVIQDKLVMKLRAFARNCGKICADCTEKAPGQICMDFNTFICMTCSGVHREFQHKCKGISMSRWTAEEVRTIEASGGNPAAQAVWMATWDATQFPIPESGDRERIRKFIELKYIDRKWCTDGHGASDAAIQLRRSVIATPSLEVPPPMPLERLLKEPVPKLIVHKETAPSSQSIPNSTGSAVSTISRPPARPPPPTGQGRDAALSSSAPHSPLPRVPDRRPPPTPPAQPAAVTPAPASVGNMLDLLGSLDPSPPHPADAAALATTPAGWAGPSGAAAAFGPPVGAGLVVSAAPAPAGNGWVAANFSVPPIRVPAISATGGQAAPAGWAGGPDFGGGGGGGGGGNPFSPEAAGGGGGGGWAEDEGWARFEQETSGAGVGHGSGQVEEGQE